MPYSAWNRFTQRYRSLQEIDAELAKDRSTHILKRVSLGSEGIAERIERIKRDNLALQATGRAAILVKTDTRLTIRNRATFKKVLRHRLRWYANVRNASAGSLCSPVMKASGMGELLKTQSFETFSLPDYYKC